MALIQASFRVQGSEALRPPRWRPRGNHQEGGPWGMGQAPPVGGRSWQGDLPEVAEPDLLSTGAEAESPQVFSEAMSCPQEAACLRRELRSRTRPKLGVGEVGFPQAQGFYQGTQASGAFGCILGNRQGTVPRSLGASRVQLAWPLGSSWGFLLRRAQASFPEPLRCSLARPAHHTACGPTRPWGRGPQTQCPPPRLLQAVFRVFSPGTGRGPFSPATHLAAPPRGPPVMDTVQSLSPGSSVSQLDCSLFTLGFVEKSEV